MSRELLDRIDELLEELGDKDARIEELEAELGPGGQAAWQKPPAP